MLTGLARAAAGYAQASAGAASTGSSGPGRATSRAVRSSASLKSTGPTISLIATVAMASARKPVPKRRELARDDHREPEREPRLRHEARPATIAAAPASRPPGARRSATPTHVTSARVPASTQRDRPELAQERHVQVGARGREEDDVDDGPGLLDVRGELVPLVGHVADDEARDHEREQRVELQVVEHRADAEAEDEEDDEHLPVDEAQVEPR